MLSLSPGSALTPPCVTSSSLSGVSTLSSPSSRTAHSATTMTPSWSPVSPSSAAWLITAATGCLTAWMRGTWLTPSWWTPSSSIAPSRRATCELGEMHPMSRLIVRHSMYNRFFCAVMVLLSSFWNYIFNVTFNVENICLCKLYKEFNLNSVG